MANDIIIENLGSQKAREAQATQRKAMAVGKAALDIGLDLIPLKKLLSLAKDLAQNGAEVATEFRDAERSLASDAAGARARADEIARLAQTFSSLLPLISFDSNELNRSQLNGLLGAFGEIRKTLDLSAAVFPAKHLQSIRDAQNILDNLDSAVIAALSPEVVLEAPPGTAEKLQSEALNFKIQQRVNEIQAEFSAKLQAVEDRRLVEKLRFERVRQESNLGPDVTERRLAEIQAKFDAERDELLKLQTLSVEEVRRMEFRQNGGPLAAGQLALVGEAGPELFVPGTAGNVLKNEDTMALLAAAGARALQGGTAGLEALGGTGGAVAAGAGLFGALFGLDEDGKPLTPEGILEKAALVREGLAEQKALLAS
ncbi:MAG: hypothetical protein KDH09_04070 [Chrysiogenetes bacterium]|nr:hypothetical protein [Chrysiogenetes bacterium]